MSAWIGTILRVNLTEGTIKKEALDLEAAKKFLGCRGLGEYYYTKEVRPGVDADDRPRRDARAVVPAPVRRLPT